MPAPHMRFTKTTLTQPLLLTFILALPIHAISSEQETATPTLPPLQQPLYKPLIERYILDELKLLRQQHQELRTEIAETLASAKLEMSDRSIRYAADTTNIIFYIITAAASILVMLGWRSIRDIKDNIESTTANKVAELTLEYENRLNALEISLKERSEQIVMAQKKISDSNLIHSLWMRAALEKSLHEKINIYNQILEVRQNDVEALTYKADALLDLDEDSWALSLTDMAIEQDDSNALAYWQRACAHAKLKQYEKAINDIQYAIERSPALKNELANESYFEGLRDYDDFKKLYTHQK